MSPHATTPGATTPGALDRRQFIRGAAALAVGTWLLGPTAAAGRDDEPLDVLLRRSARMLSVGFVVGGRLAHGASVVPAAALRHGSRALHGMTSITVRGLTAGVDAGLDAIHLDALVPAPAGTPGTADVLPFHAWSRGASPIAFGLDLDSRPRLGLALDARPAAAPAASSASAPSTPAHAVFTTGRQPGMAKLHEGLYLLGLAPGAWDHTRSLPDPADAQAWAAAGLASLVMQVSPAA